MAGWRAGPERRKGRNLQEEPRQAENQEAERHQLQTEEVDCSTQKLLHYVWVFMYYSSKLHHVMTVGQYILQMQTQSTSFSN